MEKIAALDLTREALTDHKIVGFAFRKIVTFRRIAD